MPDVGTVVLLKDTRIAAVSSVTPDGSGDEVTFEDGHVESVDQCEDIAEVLAAPPTPHGVLLDYIKRTAR